MSLPLLAAFPIVFPKDVATLKLRLDVDFQRLNAAVDQCQALDPATRAAWKAFFGIWEQYRDTDSSHWPGFLLGPLGIYNEFSRIQDEYGAGVVFGDKLVEWQKTISSAQCVNVGPSIEPPKPTPSGPSGIIEFGTNWVSMIKTVAVAAAVVGVVYLAAPLVPRRK